MKEHEHAFGCGCDGDCDRRDFLAATSTALGGLMLTSLRAEGAETTFSEAKPEENPATLNPFGRPKEVRKSKNEEAETTHNIFPTPY